MPGGRVMLRPEVSALLHPRGRHNAFGRGPDVRNGLANSWELVVSERFRACTYYTEDIPAISKSEPLDISPFMWLLLPCQISGHTLRVGNLPASGNVDGLRRPYSKLYESETTSISDIGTYIEWPNSLLSVSCASSTLNLGCRRPVQYASRFKLLFVTSPMA